MKGIKIAIMSAIFSVIFIANAYAGMWRYEVNTDRWWYSYDDGTWAANEWVWIDDNYDGIAECYCFNREGYLLMGGWTPDAYYVNDYGAWTVGGIVQTKAMWHDYYDYDWYD